MKNTVLLIEPRLLKDIPNVISNCYNFLPNWHYVFYCGKNTKEHWKNILGNYVELREMDTDNFNSSYEHSFFMKQKNLWESLYGDFVLSIQADTWIMSIEPYNINYFMNLNKSYIGGNMINRWYELERERLNFHYYNFNGGLSLRKRLDMIKVIDAFPVKLLKHGMSQHIETDPEDVYFTIGCYKLGLPVGDDIESSKFALHRIFKDKFFGTHQPATYIKDSILKLYPNLANLNSHLFTNNG
jgi:hypothetical protein